MAGRQFFSVSEKTCLQELIVKYKLNSRETSGPGNPAVKKMAWARLAQEFNSIETNTKRTEAQLKKCWDNMKNRRKQVLAEEKRERMRTGGGPFPGSSQNASCEDMMLQDAVNLELTYAIDSDTVEGNTENYSQPTTSQASQRNTTQPSTITTSQPSCSQQIVQSASIEMDVNIDDVSFASNLATSADSSGPNRQSIECEATFAESVRPTRRSTENMAEREATRTTGSRLSDYGAGTAQTPAAATARNVRANVIAEEFAIRQDSYQLTRKREDELHKLKLKEREFLVLAAEETFKKCKVEREIAEENLKCSKAKREEAELHLLILKNKHNIK